MWPTPDGATAHGFLYLPAHPEVRAPEGDLPPLVVTLHGGPTACAIPGLSVARSYWTSRGFAVLDVNYGGSTGFGRAYRELEEAGLIETRGRAGSFVSARGEEALEQARRAAREYAEVVTGLGIDPAEAMRIVEAALKDATAS